MSWTACISMPRVPRLRARPPPPPLPPPRGRFSETWGGKNILFPWKISSAEWKTWLACMRNNNNKQQNNMRACNAWWWRRRFDSFFLSIDLLLKFFWNLRQTFWKFFSVIKYERIHVTEGTPYFSFMRFSFWLLFSFETYLSYSPTTFSTLSKIQRLLFLIV